MSGSDTESESDKEERLREAEIQRQIRRDKRLSKAQEILRDLQRKTKILDENAIGTLKRRAHVLENLDVLSPKEQKEKYDIHMVLDPSDTIFWENESYLPSQSNACKLAMDLLEIKRPPNPFQVLLLSRRLRRIRSGDAHYIGPAEESILMEVLGLPQDDSFVPTEIHVGKTKLRTYFRSLTKAQLHDTRQELLKLLRSFQTRMETATATGDEKSKTEIANSVVKLNLELKLDVLDKLRAKHPPAKNRGYKNSVDYSSFSLKSAAGRLINNFSAKIAHGEGLNTTDNDIDILKRRLELFDAEINKNGRHGKPNKGWTRYMRNARKKIREILHQDKRERDPMLSCSHPTPSLPLSLLNACGTLPVSLDHDVAPRQPPGFTKVEPLQQLPEFYVENGDIPDQQLSGALELQELKSFYPTFDSIFAEPRTEVEINVVPGAIMATDVQHKYFCYDQGQEQDQPKDVSSPSSHSEQSEYSPGHELEQGSSPCDFFIPLPPLPLSPMMMMTELHPDSPAFL